MKRTYIGIDNGVSGSIGIITPEGDSFSFKTPIKTEQDYTKKKKIVSRIDVDQLMAELRDRKNPFVVIERPMVNPKMFNATLSAVRALEATLAVLEILGLPYRFIDSKEWQKALLPEGTKGSVELKKASLDIGTRLFPGCKDYFKGDADGLLIAEHVRRQGW